MEMVWYRYGSIFLTNPNVLVAIIKGMHSGKLCSKKYLQLLTGGDG